MNVLSQPLVSVVCTTYNHELYIRECLNGFVIQRTNFPIEIIVHDDASTDSTVDIVKEYEDKYPHLFNNIYRTENWYSQGKDILGYLSTQKARGKYIAICEGDDYWTDPLKLQKQVDFLEANAGYALVYTGVQKVNSNSEPMVRNMLKGVSGNITKYFFTQGNPIITASVCFRSKYLLEYGEEIKKIPFGLKMGDLPLCIYISLHGKFKYIEDKTTSYRILNESASHSKSKERVISFIANTRDVLLYFNNQYEIGIPESVIYKKYYGTLIRNMAFFDRKDFILSYFGGVKYYPSLLLNWKLLLFFFIRIIIGKKCSASYEIV